MNIDSFQTDILKIAQLHGNSDVADLSEMLALFFSPQENSQGAIDVSPEGSYDMNREMQLIDARYRAENALLDAIADGDEDFNLTLLYGSRSYENILFREELAELEKKCNRLIGGKKRSLKMDYSVENVFDVTWEVLVD